MPDDAALHETLRLHRAEQAVERAQRLLDHPLTDERAPAPAPFDDSLGLQPPDRLPHRVPADAVLCPQFLIPGEMRPELPSRQTAPQVSKHLGPQRQRAVPVHDHAPSMRRSGGERDERS